MFCISNAGIINMSRGDSIEFPISIRQGTSMDYWPYILQPKDEVYFGLMEPNSWFEEALVRKKFTYEDCLENGDIIVSFKPNDTQYLLPGLYYYQVKARIYNEVTSEYDVSTILPKTQFWIEE